MEPDADLLKARESETLSKRGAKDDLRSPPLLEAEKKSESSRDGLTSEEARHRLEKFGPNSMPDTSMHPLLMVS